MTKKKVRLLLDRELRNKYVSDQIKIGLRNQLRALRDERKVTQSELAESIGTKQSVISRIEKDPIRVGLPVFLDIANKLDVALVVRFEAIDTFVEWCENPTVKKMTPETSEAILKQTALELLQLPSVEPPPLNIAVPIRASKAKKNLAKHIALKQLPLFDRSPATTFMAAQAVIPLRNVDVIETDEDRPVTIPKTLTKSDLNGSGTAYRSLEI